MFYGPLREHANNYRVQWLWCEGFHEISKQLRYGLLPKKDVAIKKSMIIHNCQSESSVYNTFYKHGISKLETNYAHLLLSPTERCQGVV